MNFNADLVRTRKLIKNFMFYFLEPKQDEKTVRRKSQDSGSVKAPTRSTETQPLQKVKEKSSQPAKETRTKHSSTSSDNESASSIDQNAKKQIVQPKKKTLPKPTLSQPVTGGKVPPSVIKQQQLAHHSTNNGTVKPSAGMKAAAQQKHTAQANKKALAKEKRKDASSNSSESEVEKTPKKEHKNSATTSTKSSSQQRPRGRGRPRKNPIPVPKVAEKPPVSSSTSSTDSSTSDSDDSDSESSATTIKTVEKTPKKQINSSSNSVKQDPSKKLTRSSSTRKSKHLVGKCTDSDSDSTKRSLSKSPAKKTLLPVASKVNSKKTPDVKSLVVKQELEEKRECPIEGCNSTGHLSGNAEIHFTVEACPMYHKMTTNDTKQLLADRKKRDEERKKGIDLFDRSRKVLTAEQKNYQQKVKEARSKFKSPTPSSHDKKDKNDNYDRDREPNLKGIVPDYDYQLFRQAQAAASENIENELKALPASKGTKYITMGKHCIRVWYQSPYPEDVARLPKLYLCEFCLRYQKCAISMKRHAAKCLWRHPPGDEVRSFKTLNLKTR